MTNTSEALNAKQADDDLIYEACRYCSQTIKCRVGSGRPWVHTRTGKARSITPVEHDAAPVDPPKPLGNPNPKARPGWHGPPPS